MKVRIGNDVNLEGNVNLPDTVQDFYVIREGIVVIKMGVTIAEGFRIPV